MHLGSVTKTEKEIQNNTYLAHILSENLKRKD